MQISEAILWERFISGDEDAFSQLYKLCYRDLYAYGLSLGMGREFVKDSIHDIFFNLYTKKVKLRNNTSLKSFLFRSMKNSFINQLLKDGREIPLIDGEYEFSFSYTIEDSIISDESQRILMNRVKLMMSCLSPRQTEIIYLRFLHEMDFSDIAEVLGMGVQAARNLLFRALKKMREEHPEMYMLVGSYLILCIYYFPI